MRASEWTLLVACAGLLVLGPAMAYQEFAEAEAAQRAAELEAARQGLVGSAGDPTLTAAALADADVSFRGAWRWPLFALVVAVGIFGSAVAIRVARRRRWRAVSGRLLGLLLVGMTVLDLAFLVDVQWGFASPILARAWSTVWAYPLGALLVAGALYRITELEPHFGTDAPPAPVLSPAMIASAGEAPAAPAGVAEAGMADRAP